MWRARVEFELLKLLATDRKALATARRLGRPLAVQVAGHPQVARQAAEPPAAAPPAPAARRKRNGHGQQGRAKRRAAAAVIKRFIKSVGLRKRWLKLVDAARAAWVQRSVVRATEHCCEPGRFVPHGARARGERRAGAAAAAGGRWRRADKARGQRPGAATARSRASRLFAAHARSVARRLPHHAAAGPDALFRRGDGRRAVGGRDGGGARCSTWRSGAVTDELVVRRQS